MAKEEIAFEVSVDGSGNGAKSLKSLRAEFKQLQSELEKTEVGTKAYQQTLNNLANVRDEIRDLNEDINALNPEGKVMAFTNVAGKLASGFQAATGAAALFGVQSEELERQLLKVQAATALAQGINSVIGITDAFRVLGTVIAANPIMALVGVITAITTAVVGYTLANNEAANATKNLTAEIDAQKQAAEDLNKSIDRITAIRKAQGAEELELLKLRKEGLIELYNSQREITEKAAALFLSADEENSAEREKIFNEETQKLIQIKTEGRIVTAQIAAEENKLNKEKADNAVKNAQDAANKAAKINTEFYNQQVKDKQTYEDVIFGIEAMSWDENIYPLKVKKAEQEIKLAKQTEDKKNEFRKAAEAELEKRAVARADAEVRINENYFNAISDLSATYFNAQLASVRGNVAEEEKIRKKQFQVNKAFSAVKATMDGINAVQGVLAQSLLYGPATIPLAVSMGLAAAANVAKILSQQYQSPQTNTGQLNISAGDAPQIQTQAPNTGAIPLTRLNEQGQNLSNPVRAYVVETDVSESQERVRRLQEQNTF